MIYLLHGSDTTRSREKLNEIIDEYRKKIGADLSFYSFDAEEDAPEEIRRALETNSLFSNKKVVTLKHLSLSSNKELLLGALENIKNSRETLVFLWERELDAKKLGELQPYCSKIQEFKTTQRPSAPSTSIFRLGDTFFTSPREGLRTLLGLLHDGHEDFNLFSYLANHSRALLTIKHCNDAGRSVPPECGIHPFVIKKAAALMRGLPKEKLLVSLRQFFEEDYKIKTGASRPRDSLLSLLADKHR